MAFVNLSQVLGGCTTCVDYCRQSCRLLEKKPLKSRLRGPTTPERMKPEIPSHHDNLGNGMQSIQDMRRLAMT